MYVCVSVSTPQHGWRAENYFQELVLFFHCGIWDFVISVQQSPSPTEPSCQSERIWSSEIQLTSEKHGAVCDAWQVAWHGDGCTRRDGVD